jgi:hypothetical protein
MERKSVRSKEASKDALGAHGSLYSRCGVPVVYCPKLPNTVVQMV